MIYQEPDVSEDENEDMESDMVEGDGEHAVQDVRNGSNTGIDAGENKRKQEHEDNFPVKKAK